MTFAEQNKLYHALRRLYGERLNEDPHGENKEMTMADPSIFQSHVYIWIQSTPLISMDDLTAHLDHYLDHESDWHENKVYYTVELDKELCCWKHIITCRHIRNPLDN